LKAGSCAGISAMVRVTTAIGVALYLIDRWD
jgi:hypothetical protein